MKLTVIHGSPRRGNTYRAAQLFLEALKKRGQIEAREFFLPQDLPEFCRGCIACAAKKDALMFHTQSRSSIPCSIRTRWS